MRKLFRNLFTIVIVGLAAALVVYWSLHRERLPDEIRIAAGPPGSLYSTFAYAFSGKLSRKTGKTVTVIDTEGALENRRLLLDGKAELALFSDGAGPMEGTGILAPLYDELVHIMVRGGDGDEAIKGMADLGGKTMAFGSENSGIRPTALRILQHYQVNPSGIPDVQHPVEALKTRADIPAAIALTGIADASLQQLLSTGDFRLLEIEDAEALTFHYPFYAVGQIPKGLYGENPSPVPERNMSTLSAKAVLIAPSTSSELLVSTVLDGLYASDLQTQIPTLIPKQTAAAWPSNSWLPKARAYFEPYKQLKFISTMLEPLSAAKELILALVLGAFFLRNRLQLARKRHQEKAFHAQKERLDEFIQEIVKMQRIGMETRRPDELRQLQGRLTELQEGALTELTDEKLRGDQMFLLFLTLCADVGRKLENRLLTLGLSRNLKPAGSSRPKDSEKTKRQEDA